MQVATDFSISSQVVVYSTVFLDTLGFGLVIPVLPYYFSELPPYLPNARGIWYGCLVGGFSFGAFVGNLLLGALSDRLGRKPVLMLGLFADAGLWALTAYAPTLYWLIAARVATGLFAGTGAICSAYVAEVTSEADRGKYIGRLGAWTSIGITIGPALGIGFVQWFGVTKGFYVGSLLNAGLIAVTFVMAGLFFKEPPTIGKTRLTIAVVQELVADSDVLKLLLTSFTFSLFFTAFDTIMPLYVATDMGLPPIYLFVVFGGFVLLNVISNFGFSKMSKRVGVRKLGVVGIVMGAVSLVIMPLDSQKLYFVGLSVALMGMSQGFVVPGFTVLASFMSRGAHGTLLGTRRAVVSLGRSIGPAGAGLLYGMPSKRYFHVEHMFPFLTGGVFAMITLCIYLSIKRTTPSTIVVDMAEGINGDGADGDNDGDNDGDDDDDNDDDDDDKTDERKPLLVTTVNPLSSKHGVSVQQV